MALYSKRFVVRWSDVDMNRHMRNTSYSEYCIDVRLSFLKEHGFPLEEFGRRGFGPVILKEELRYLREIGPGESFEVDFKLMGFAPDGSRWRVRHEIRKHDGTPAATVDLEGLWLDLARRRPVPPPRELREAFERLDHTEDFEELRPIRREES